MDDDFEPIKFPEDPSVNLNISRIGSIVCLSYQVEDGYSPEVHLELKPDDALKFADLVRKVAEEILEENLGNE